MNNNNYKCYQVPGMCLALMMASPRNHLQWGGDNTHVAEEESRHQEELDPLQRGSYLARCGVFTQQGFVVGGKDRCVIVDVQHRHQSDAFPDLDWIL